MVSSKGIKYIFIYYYFSEL